MLLNTAGTSINTSLYIPGTTIINSAHTCLSSLNVSGETILNSNVGIGTTNNTISKRTINYIVCT